MKHLSSAIAPTALMGLLLGAQHAQAQDVYNNGAQLTVVGGATLYVPGNLTNTNSGTLTNNNSTVQVNGNFANSSAATLDMGTAGVLEVKGNVVNTATVTPGTGTLRLTGTSAQALDMAGAQLNQVVVNNTATTPLVTVPSDVTVNNALTLTNGMVRTTAASRVILPNGATVSGETNGRYVAGNLESRRTAVSGAAAVAFANGASITPNNNLGDVAVTRTAGLNTANVSYGVNPSDPAKKSIDQIWTIVPAAQPAAGTPATVAFTWLSDNDNGQTNFAFSRVWQGSGSSNWVATGPYVNASSRSISTPVTSLSRFTVSNAASPLPVELLSFKAVREGDAARLTWRTASEKDNDHFDLEVSADGQSFSKFGAVAGQGTKATPTDYSALDPRLLAYNADPVYYRLRQVDVNGRESYSPVQVVQVVTTGFSALAYPNPMRNDGTTIQIRTAEAGAAELAMYDATGRLLIGLKTQLLPGLNEVRLAEAAKLATGTYFLKINQGQQHTLLKLAHE